MKKSDKLHPLSTSKHQQAECAVNAAAEHMHPALIAGRCPDRPSIHPIPMELYPESIDEGEPVLLSPVKASKSGTLQFIQETASKRTSAGKPLASLSRELTDDGWHRNQNGKLIDPVHLVKDGDKLVAIDNRRLIASMADTQSENKARVFAVLHEARAPLSARNSRRFSIGSQRAEYWEDAIQSRALGNENRKLPSSELPRLRRASREDLSQYQDVLRGPGFYRTPKRQQAVKTFHYR